MVVTQHSVLTLWLFLHFKTLHLIFGVGFLISSQENDIIKLCWCTGFNPLLRLENRIERGSHLILLGRIQPVVWHQVFVYHLQSISARRLIVIGSDFRAHDASHRSTVLLRKVSLSIKLVLETMQIKFRHRYRGSHCLGATRSHTGFKESRDLCVRCWLDWVQFLTRPKHWVEFPLTLELTVVRAVRHDLWINGHVTANLFHHIRLRKYFHFCLLFVLENLLICFWLWLLDLGFYDFRSVFSVEVLSEILNLLDIWHCSILLDYLIVQGLVCIVLSS